MFRHTLALSRRFALIAFTAVLVVLIAGCDRDGDGRIDASAEYFGETTRPAEIAQAYTSLQSGQPGQAYSTAQGFIDTHPGSPYRWEAFYLAGIALSAQGQYEEGKEKLEV